MSRICDITGKRPMVGNNVSHANNKTKKWYYPNLQVKSFYIPEEGKWVRLKISASAIRTINKKGVRNVMLEAKKMGTLRKRLHGLLAKFSMGK